MKSLFGRGLFHACPVAERSDIYVDLAANEVRMMGKSCEARAEMVEDKTH